MMNRLTVFVLSIMLLVLAGCTGSAPPLEVTRIVIEQVEVTVEVTRVVVEQVVEEVAVEVTRLVEVTAAAAPTGEPEVEATLSPTDEPTVEPTATIPVSGLVYTVQAGDTLATIAEQFGTTIAALQAANNMNDSSLLIAGQEIMIPNGDDQGPPPQPATPDSTPAELQPTVPAAQAANYLPNPSFEGGWHFYLYNELQVPDGWQLATDEGPNNLQPGAGGLFNRPEVRVVPAKDLPPAEHNLFIMDGNKTLKAFKGGAPTSFSLFTDVALPPGSYRMKISFYPDTVAAYDNGEKTFTSDPLAAEVRVIVDGGGSAWQGTRSGQRNVVTFDFVVDEGRNVRVGASFRNRFIMANNGWFIDDWSLTPLEVDQ